MLVLNFLKCFKTRITVQYAVEKGPKFGGVGLVAAIEGHFKEKGTICFYYVMAKNWGLGETLASSPLFPPALYFLSIECYTNYLFFFRYDD